MISIYMKGRKQKRQSKKGNNNKGKVIAIVIGLKRVEQEMFGGITGTVIDAVVTKMNMTQSLSSSLVYGKYSHLI